MTARVSRMLAALAVVVALVATQAPAEAEMGGHWQRRAQLSDRFGFNWTHALALNVKTKRAPGVGCVVTAVAVSLRNYDVWTAERIGDRWTRLVNDPGILGGMIVGRSYGGTRRKFRTAPYRISKHHHGVLKRVFDVPNRRVSGINVEASDIRVRLKGPDAFRTLRMKRHC